MFLGQMASFLQDSVKSVLSRRSWRGCSHLMRFYISVAASPLHECNCPPLTLRLFIRFIGHSASRITCWSCRAQTGHGSEFYWPDTQLDLGAHRLWASYLGNCNCISYLSHTYSRLFLQYIWCQLNSDVLSVHHPWRSYSRHDGSCVYGSRYLFQQLVSLQWLCTILNLSSGRTTTFSLLEGIIQVSQLIGSVIGSSLMMLGIAVPFYFVVPLACLSIPLAFSLPGRSANAHTEPADSPAQEDLDGYIRILRSGRNRASSNVDTE